MGGEEEMQDKCGEDGGWRYGLERRQFAGGYCKDKDMLVD